MMGKPVVYVIAGPKGAGKTTFAVRFLPFHARCVQFVNPDLIANGVSPFAPESAAIEAGRIMLARMHSFMEERKSFGMETTLSGKSYLNLFKKMKSAGYRIHLFYLWVQSSALAVIRIQERVRLGGHHVPKADVRRRFKKSLENLFRRYRPLFDSILFFDNSGRSPVPVFEEREGNLLVHDKKLYGIVTREAGL